MAIQLQDTTLKDVTNIKLGTAQTDVEVVYLYRNQRLEWLWQHASLPNIVSFSVSPDHIPASQNVDASTVTLAWSVTGATQIEVKHANGNTVAASTNPTGSTSVPASGVDTVYTLEATNSSGTVREYAYYWRSVPSAINSFTVLRSSTAPAGVGLAIHTVVLQIVGVAHPWHDDPFTATSTPSSTRWTSAIVNRAFRNSSGNTRTGTVQLSRTTTGSVDDVVYNLSLSNGFTTATSSLTVSWP